MKIQCKRGCKCEEIQRTQFKEEVFMCSGLPIKPSPKCDTIRLCIGNKKILHTSINLTPLEGMIISSALSNSVLGKICKDIPLQGGSDKLIHNTHPK